MTEDLTPSAKIRSQRGRKQTATEAISNIYLVQTKADIDRISIWPEHGEFITLGYEQERFILGTETRARKPTAMYLAN